MPRYDNAPVPQTCPKIDEVRDFIETIEWDENEEDLKAGAAKAVAMLEVIRDHNGKLRDWGNTESKRADENEKECDELKKNIDELEKEIKWLKAEVKDLEQQLSESETVNN